MVACVRIKKREDQKAHPLGLLFENNRGLAWAQTTVKDKHYLHNKIHEKAHPLAYIVTLGEKWVGCLIFGRPQASRVHEWQGKEAAKHPGMHWFGPLHEVIAGTSLYSQWEILNLARVWLDPCIQDPASPEYVPNAASQVISEALKRVAYDYLAYYPPAFLNEPYKLRQCISYCYDDRIGTLYKACNFENVRVSQRRTETGKQMMTTYMRPLRGLSHDERRKIEQASILNAKLRQKRAKKTFHDTMIMVPMFRRRRLLQKKNVAA